jgi:hypothetical protein
MSVPQPWVRGKLSPVRKNVHCQMSFLKLLGKTDSKDMKGDEWEKNNHTDYLKFLKKFLAYMFS